MFRINSEAELMQLLKIVSQEAVKKSRKTLSEAVDSAQSRYITNLRASENTYGVKLTEQEEESAAPPEEEEATDTEAPADEETENQVEEEEPIDPETLGVSFDSVVKDINTLRSGRSTKDKEIKDELLGYYDRLDEDERKILHLFLSEISKILQGAIDAAGAQDPSEPPFNAEITFGEEGDESQTGDAQSSQDDEQPEGSEDTSPPIRVNERQNLKEIRKTIKRLMKRY